MLLILFAPIWLIGLLINHIISVNTIARPNFIMFANGQKNVGFAQMDPTWLDNKNLRNEIRGGYYKIMRKIAEVSDQNLVRNSDAYISSGGKVDPGK